MPEVFAHHDIDFGHTEKIKHHIKLNDETSYKQRARPIHPKDIEAVKNHLREFLSSGIIRELVSPFTSSIVVVKKKNGDVRLCIDYRKLNHQTIKHAYALPNLEDTFSALTGSKWFSVLDLVAKKEVGKVSFIAAEITFFLSTRQTGSGGPLQYEKKYGKVNQKGRNPGPSSVASMGLAREEAVPAFIGRVWGKRESD